jgi:hypothetical protein
LANIAIEHEDSHRDSPRLSTVQALLILMKAREFHPKRGYFYRSWSHVVDIINMAKDLNLNEHLEAHKGGNCCQLTPTECVSRTRTWQLLYILESMIGAPQGECDSYDFLWTFNLRVA